jgi:hypothetical protein
MITVYRGARAPEALAVTITRGRSNLDLTSVSAVTLVVRDEQGTERSWTASVSGAAADQLTATHVFSSDGTDVPVAKVYRVMPQLTVPGGIRRCVPFSLQVLE